MLFQLGCDHHFLLIFTVDEVTSPWRNLSADPCRRLMVA